MGQERQKPLVVVAGQVPPPTGGQNVMIQRIVDELAVDERWRTVHLPFFFTPSFKSVRRFRLAKIAELFAVCWRFLRIVQRFGRPDLLLYPSGGPQTVPVVRDILLLPLLCLLSKRVVVQFHAAGVAERLAVSNGPLERLLRMAYQPVAGAIVMTAFNRRDPEALGIREIAVIPHRLPDENPAGHVPDYSGFGKMDPSPLDPRPSIPQLTPHSTSNIHHPTFNILYAGHLYDLKGTPQLVEAFAKVAPAHPHARLVLMGEFLPPYTEEACRSRCAELGISERVEITGVLRGEKKAAQFRAAHLFVFPSVAPYESFGLVLAEAMMWGLPIVATDWRGNRDVAGPDALYATVDGLLPEHLADCLQEAITQPTRLAAMSAASRTRYETSFRLGATECDYRRWAEEDLSAGNAWRVKDVLREASVDKVDTITHL